MIDKSVLSTPRNIALLSLFPVRELLSWGQDSEIAKLPFFDGVQKRLSRWEDSFFLGNFRMCCIPNRQRAAGVSEDVHSISNPPEQRRGISPLSASAPCARGAEGSPMPP